MNTPLPEVCTTNARQQAQQGALFVDVREALDTQALMLDVPEVHYLPMSELASRWQELPRDRDLVIVCQDGRTSAQAAQWLQAQGVERVSPMHGGVLLWLQKGYPVTGRRFQPKE